jgi:hypothetical protein
MRSPFLAVLAVMVVNTAAFSQDTSGVSGCYRFDRAYFRWVGRRSDARNVVRDSTDILRLAPNADVSRPFPTPVLDVYPIPFVADSPTTLRWLRPSYWTFVDPSTVNVVWRNGLYGPVFRLSIVGDSLHGRVRFTTDIVGREPPSEAASAVRIACPG